MTSSETPINLDQSDPVPLDPIILSARDELLEKYSDKSFEEQITFYKAVIEGEKDSLSRLSAMAARVYILRKRLALLAGNVMEDQLDELSNKQSGFDLDNTLAEVSDVKDPEVISNNKSWMRLRIVDSSEVNGVRFPAGVVIDVKREDGEKLIESGKAEFMSTEESRQFKSEVGLEEVEADAVSEEGAAEEVEADAVSEEGAAEEVEADAVSEEGAAEEVEADAVSEEGAAEEVEADAVSEEGAAEEVEADAVSEEGTTEEVEADAVSEEGTAEEVKADAVSEEGTAEEVEADAVSEEGTAEEVEADAVSEEGTAEEVEADAVSEEGAAEEVEADAVSGKPVDLENKKE